MRPAPFVAAVVGCLSFFAAPAMAAAPAAFPGFKVQEIDKTLKVGYGLKVVDLNQDGKLDIVVADSARVIWFDQAQDWKLRTIIDNAKAGVKPDNVCLDVADIDGDGKLDVAVGADWQINNTSAGGSLQWLRQGATIDEWTVHSIAKSIPTLHRIRFADIDGDGRPELLVGPIRGVGSTLRENYLDKPLRLLAFPIPKDPAGEWGEPRVLDESMHHLHNFTPVDLHPGKSLEIFTASSEGVGLFSRATDGKWRLSPIGVGFQGEPKASKGSSEVKVGFNEAKQAAYVAAIEPLHGHELVTYWLGAAPPPNRTRGVVDGMLKAGHALWCADLDGDGNDEIIVGFRDATEKGVYPGVNAYRATTGLNPLAKWEKHVIEDKSMACEDLACADLNGDGRIDIVACGRTTGNVRIYWNQGAAKQ
jgi:hypothetical protein